MLEVSALAVGSNEYTLLCAFNSVLFLKQIAENAECNCRLGCLTRFGNNINAESASAADINQLLVCPECQKEKTYIRENTDGLELPRVNASFAENR